MTEQHAATGPPVQLDQERKLFKIRLNRLVVLGV
jgi:hypothetical protein